MNIVEFTEEKVEDCFSELSEYFEEHGKVEILPVFVNYEHYVEANKQGHLVLFTIRCNGKLGGYSAWWVQYHPHHDSQIFAVNDCVYIHPELRAAYTRSFFEYCERQFPGVDAIQYMFKTDHDHPELMESLGYSHTEKVYTKCPQSVQS